MNDDQLKDRLRSIGMTCFVRYFRLFADPSLSNADVTSRLVKREGWAPISTLHRRVRGARSIIDAGRARDALMVIKDSEKVAFLRPDVDSLLKEL